MPRARNRVPSYRKHSATNQAVVTLNGRDFYLGPHGSPESREKYNRLVAEWLGNACQPRKLAARRTVADDAELLVVGLISAYWQFALEYYQKDGKPTGEVGAIRAALKPLHALYGPTPAADFGPLALEAVRDQMIKLGWARNNVNRSVMRVRRMFRWGVKRELVPPSLLEGLRALDGLRRGRTTAHESAPVMPVDDATVDATLEHLPPIVADMVRLQRLSGMRPAEVCSLRPCDVDRSRDVWIYRPESHKTEHHGRDRVVFIGPKGQGVLLRYLARDSTSCCFRPVDTMAKHLAARSEARATPLSCGNRPGSNRRRKRRADGEAYTTESYRRAIARAADKAFPHPTLTRIPRRRLTAEQAAELAAWQSKHRWAPNRLRHAAATEIRRQFGLEAAQVVLGHSQANVTQVYAERDAAKGCEVARAIG